MTTSKSAQAGVGTFDFIVVGGGIAGRALSTRLAREGRTVLALETMGEVELATERLPGVGGTPDGMLLYPSNQVWEELHTRTGDAAWSAEQARRRYERIEQIENRPVARALHRWCFYNPARRGFNGWLPTRALGSGLGAARDRYFGPADPNDWSHVRAQREVMWCRPPAHDVNVEEVARLRQLDTSRARGTTLTLRRGVRVTRLLADEPSEPGANVRITGVQYLEPAPGGPSILRRAIAQREVILCNGVFEVPRLLLFSGIGPAPVLERHGIPLLVDRPGVGAGYAACAEIAVETDVPGDFQAFARGGMEGTMVITLHSSQSDSPAPDVLLYRRALGGRSPEEMTWRWTIRVQPSSQPGRCWRRTPDSVGTERSAPPRTVDRTEADALLDAVKFLRRILFEAGVDEEAARLVAPTEVAALTGDEAELASFIRRQARSAAPVGTCALGREGDPLAVLDARLRVKGTENLRVVDEASFPTSPGFFPDVPLLVAAELAADDLLRTMGDDESADSFAADLARERARAERENRGGGAAVAALVAALTALRRRFWPAPGERAAPAKPLAGSV